MSKTEDKQVSGESNTTIVNSAMFGHIEPYVLGDDFEQYMERFDHMCIINSALQINKVSSLISYAGADLYKILKSLIAPKAINSFTYETLIEKLTGYFKPKKNIRAERFKFWSRKIKDNEDLNDFIVELKILAENCQFGEYLDQALCDKFIFAVTDENLQRKLLNEELSKTFDDICKLALNFQLTAKEVKDIQHNSNNSYAFQQNWIGRSRHRKGRSPSRHSQRRSFSRSSSKSLRNIQCYKCKQWGHYANACHQGTSKHFNNTNKNHKINNNLNFNSQNKKNEISDNNFSVSNLRLGNITSVLSKTDAVIVSVKINSENIEMEVDSGACFSIISAYQYEKFFKNSKLHKFDKKLTVVTGEKVKVLGAMNVHVSGILKSDENSLHKLELVVIERADRKDFLALMGRNWLDVLYRNWKDCFRVNSLESNNLIVKDCCNKYPEVFDEKYHGAIREFSAEVVMEESATPIFHKAYTVPYGLRDAVSKELDRLIEFGILKPVKICDWASPFVIVRKKNGSIRLCLDGKATINRYIKTDHYSLPLIEDILCCFSGCKYFCVLDLYGAFQQVKIADSSQKYLTISTDRGLFCFTRLPFGIKSAPSTFQYVIDNILQKLVHVKAYIDDIIIGGITWEECKQNLLLTLERLQKYNVKVRLEKCKFFETQVEYLGFIINQDGIRPKQDKMKAILNAPSPTDITSLKAYTGLLNFYGSFIRNLSIRLAPLYELSKTGNDFIWTKEHEHIFQESKKWLNECNLLVHYDQRKPIGIVCDASAYGVGGVLFHIEANGQERPIKFISSTLSETERKYSQIEREALAVIFTLQRLHKFLYGQKFIIFSDHKPLEIIFGSKKINKVTAHRLQRWAIILAQYDYEIRYRKASMMGNADALSRLPLNEPTQVVDCMINFFNITGDLPLKVEDIACETDKDPLLIKLKRFIETSSWPSILEDPVLIRLNREKFELSVKSGCILFGQRVIIPRVLKEKILEIIHTGHMGIVRMKSIARGSVWWLNIDRDIEHFAKSCDICQQCTNKKSGVQLKSWRPTTYPFERVHMDFLKFQGEVLFLVVDDFSKWLEVFIMRQTTALDVIKVLRRIFCVFGLPTELISDNGPPFTSKELIQFYEANNIKYNTSPYYHPESNGLAERNVQTLKIALKKNLLEKNLHNISLQFKIENFLFQNRNSPSTVTKLSPSQIVFQYKPRTIIDFIQPSADNKSIENVKLKPKPKPILVQSKNRNLGRHVKNNSKTDIEFKPKEEVWYRSYHNNHVSWIAANIVEKLSKVVYLIQVNGSRKKAHGDQLKKRIKKQVTFDQYRKFSDNENLSGSIESESDEESFESFESNNEVFEEELKVDETSDSDVEINNDPPTQFFRRSKRIQEKQNKHNN